MKIHDYRIYTFRTPLNYLLEDTAFCKALNIVEEEGWEIVSIDLGNGRVVARKDKNTIETEEEMRVKWDAVWVLFHMLWGHCKESPEYSKGDWKDLQARLRDMQEHPNRRMKT